MSQSINKTRKSFIVIISLLYGFTMFTGVAITCSSFIEKVSNQWAENLNKRAHLAVNQLKYSEEIDPSLYDGEYFIFVINKNSGDFILEREIWADENPDLWKSHETKVLYEMQKQGQGWIFYPEVDAFNLTKDQRIIRYLTINELNAIIAIEGNKKSPLEILQVIFEPNFFIKLSGLFIMGFIIIYTMTNRTITIVRNMVVNSLENNMMSMPTDTTWSRNEVKSSDTQQLNQKNDSFIQQTQTQPTSEPEPERMESSLDNNQKQQFEPVEPDQLKTQKKAQKRQPAPFTQQEIDEPFKAYEINKEIYEETVVKEEPIKKVVPKRKVVKSKVKKEKSPLDDLTIEMQGIKSPVLRKLIKEIRSE